MGWPQHLSPVGVSFHQVLLISWSWRPSTGLSLPQAKLQIAGKAGEVCHSRLVQAVGSQDLEVGLEMGGYTLGALLGLIPEDQELNLTSWTPSLRLDQPTSMPRACFCRLGVGVGDCHTRHSIPTCALPGCFQACSSCTGGLCLHQEPQEARPCHLQGRDVVCSWLKNVPCSIPGSLAARRVTSTFLMLGFGSTSTLVTMRERGLFLSVLPERYLQVEETRGVTYWLPPSPSPAFLFLSARMGTAAFSRTSGFCFPLRGGISSRVLQEQLPICPQLLPTACCI